MEWTSISISISIPVTVQQWMEGGQHCMPTYRTYERTELQRRPPLLETERSVTLLSVPGATTTIIRQYNMTTQEEGRDRMVCSAIVNLFWVRPLECRDDEHDTHQHHPSLSGRSLATMLESDGPVLSCPVLFCSVLFCSVLSCPEERNSLEKEGAAHHRRRQTDTPRTSNSSSMLWGFDSS